jgi:hypothetical protein
MPLLPPRLLDLARRPHRVLATAAYWVGRTRSERPHIFIVGAPRSGTTLLKSLLVAHSDLGGSDYESTGIFGLRDLGTYSLGELPREQTRRIYVEEPDVVAFYDRVVAALLERSGSRRFVDKLQVQPYRLRFAASRFPKAQFIRIVRDGRDAYCSALRHPHVRQSRSAAAYARYWRRTTAVPERVLPAGRLLTLRYEDLVSDAEATMRGLMRDLGETFEPQQIDPARFSKTTSITKREVHKNLGQAIGTQSAGRWQRELSEEDAQAFDHHAGDALRGFGYGKAGKGGPLTATRA